jgi:hypothetical protein
MAEFYEIRIRGRLPIDWQDWIDGLHSKQLANGDTLIFGEVADQSALLGLLARFQVLQLSLIEMRNVPADAADNLKELLSE